MKSLKNFAIIFSIIFFCSNNIFAQEDTKAKPILDAVSAKMKSYTSMKIGFSYNMTNTKTNVNETKTGVIQVKGNKYRLEIGGQIVFCNGTTVWTYIEDDNEVNINNVSTQEDAANPTTILNNYSTNFKPKFIKETVQLGKTLQIIDLVPIKTKSYYKVRLYIDNTLKQIVSTVIYDKNGSTYSYTVTSFVTNVAMNDSIFIFNKADYPDVEENDMR
ncbi:MAG TPA: outer membrane lipoprotein carrier protein LolA [Bacteroidales bacterium]|nr:outer membrane lipoprotein carrier protein LolA [Bacteroidales bacterium]HPS17885.1 outer membrane lipoprotein carrier protein LolA [Bacteroidales bacterium]